MFTSVHIENFRGIKNATLSGFKPLNIFWGKNDCGKTTLLEALFLLSGPCNPRLPFNINSFRAYPRIEEDDLKLWFYRLNEQYPIILRSSNTINRELIITPIHSEPIGEDENLVADQSNPRERIYGLSLLLRYNNQEFRSELRVSGGNHSQLESIRADGYREALQTRFVHMNSSLEGSIELLNAIIKENKKEFLLKAMRLYDPRIADWAVINGVVLLDLGFPAMIPINLMGNGIRKLLNVLVSIYSCKNGMVFVDEIDNGVHFLHFKDMWRAIRDAAKDYNVQVFATTHSLDCMRGFSDALDEESRAESVNIGQGFVLDSDEDGRLDAKSFSVYQLKLAFANDVDLR